MKKLFVLILIAIFINGWSKNISAQVQLKVITYNIMGMKPGTEPLTRIYHIIQNLKVLNPDIIGLQEINESISGGGADNQSKTISDSLSAHFGIPYYYFNAQTHLAWNNQYKEFIGIITKYPLEQRGSHQLVQGVFPRRVVWNLITTPLGKIHFFNTHFDYQNSSVRLQQATQTISYITQQENQYQSIATFLTGDFNDTPGSSPINFILNAGFSDSFTAANPALNGFTVPAHSPTSKIDYIFNRNTGQLIIDSSLIIMNRPYFASSFSSDHLGVMTIFSINPSSVDGQGEIGMDYKLQQNYPNPFNSSTKISWQAPVSSWQTLKVYDILGKEIASLVNEELSAGEYEVEFNSKSGIPNLSSGIYFYKLEAGSFIQTRKMTLLK